MSIIKSIKEFISTKPVTQAPPEPEYEKVFRPCVCGHTGCRRLDIGFYRCNGCGLLYLPTGVINPIVQYKTKDGQQ